MMLNAKKGKSGVFLKTGRILVGLAMLIHWLVILRGTDSYWSIYFICTVSGAFALVRNTLSNRFLFFLNQKEIKGAFLFSAFFSIVVCLSNYLLFFSAMNIVEGLLMFAEGCFLAVQVFMWVLSGTEVFVSPVPEIRWGFDRRLFLTAFLFISLIYTAALFFYCYPGNLTYDSVNQLHQVFTHEYSNHHPFWHTMIIRMLLDLGLLLFKDINKAIALYSVFQTLVMAGIFSFLIMTLYQSGIPTRWIIIALIIYALTPYHIMYSFSMWKDVLFSGAVALFICSLYRELRGIGHPFTSDLTLIVSSVGFGLLRNNGWIALFLTFIVFVFVLWKNKRRIVWITLSVLCITFFLTHPILNWLHVAPTEDTEYLSVPLQQIARVLIDGKELTQEEREQLSIIFDLDKITDVYHPHLADPMKDMVKNKNLEYLSAHKSEYLKLWLRIGLRYPMTYLFAWVDQTKGYWNSGYEYYITSNIVFSNNYGIERCVVKTGSVPISDAFALWEDTFFSGILFEPFRSIGFHVWLIILALVVSSVRGRKESLLCVPLLSVIVTILISTPVFCEFRYSYAVFISFPFVIPILLSRCTRSGVLSHSI